MIVAGSAEVVSTEVTDTDVIKAGAESGVIDIGFAEEADVAIAKAVPDIQSG